MADSCRPVSRHGRYNATGPSSVPYTSDVNAYSSVDYSNDVYQTKQSSMDRPERPRTSRGKRRRIIHRPEGEIPPRPSSRRSRPINEPPDNDDDREGFGRPASRVGFSPEVPFSYSHDEYSRQKSDEGMDEGHHVMDDSGRYVPRYDVAEDLYGRDLTVTSSPFRDSPAHGSPYLRDHQETSRYNFKDRQPRESASSREYPSKDDPIYKELFRQGSQYSFRPSSRDKQESPYSGGQKSPQYGGTVNQQESPTGDWRHQPSLHHGKYVHQQDSPTGDWYGKQSPQYGQVEKSQMDYQTADSPLNEQWRQRSPLQRQDYTSRYHEQHASHYSESYQESYRQSPNRDRPGNNSPVTPRDRPPSGRPRSSRPKSARRKRIIASARYRPSPRQEDESVQQSYNASYTPSGEPVPRPPSSLSRYTPLPAIGQIGPESTDTPAGTNKPSEPVRQEVEHVTSNTQRLTLDDSLPHGEDIAGAPIYRTNNINLQKHPDVGELSEFPQQLTQEIFRHSQENIDKHIPVLAQQQTDGLSPSVKQTSSGSSPDIFKTKPLDRLHLLPSEPTEEEPRILLAIRLPDGKRYQRYFNLTDPLESVMHFAENVSDTDYSAYHLACNAPKTIFYNISQQIQDTEIQDRTVLYLEERE